MGSGRLPQGRKVAVSAGSHFRKPHSGSWTLLRTGVRLALGALMIWSGAVKLGELPSFALTVRAYDVLPVWMIHPFAIWLPGAEAAVGTLLLLGVWTRSSAASVAVMFVAFAVALGVNVARGADLSCGCFGLDGAAASPTVALVRDLVFLAGAVVLVARPGTRFAVEGGYSPESADQAPAVT